MARSNRAYWIERMQHREAVTYDNGTLAIAGLVREYKASAASIRKEINDFYMRYAGENGLNYEQAVREMSRPELQEWNNTVEGYVKEIQSCSDPAVRERLIKDYNARYYNSRISRFEGLCGEIDIHLNGLYMRANERFRELLGDTYTEGYYKTLYDIQCRKGFNGSFSTIDSEMVENALAYPWSGANFSDRLWKNKTALVDSLRETLTQGLIRGDSISDMSNAIADKLNASYSNAERLVRTESSHIHNTAELEAYESAGYEQYEFMASLGERTCKVCGGLDGKRFKLSEKQEGVNFPPVHPNCRCTTIGYDPDDDIAELENKQEQLSYEEWYQQYVEGREQKRIESNNAVTVELPSGSPRPVVSGGNAANVPINSLTQERNGGIINTADNEFVPLPRNNVVNVLREESQEWIDCLSNEEIRAIQKYTKNSGDDKDNKFYKRLNAMLRGSIPTDPTLEYYSGLISAAITKNKLKHDIVCYRTINADVYSSLNVGDIFIERQFISTSAIESRALSGSYKIKINANAGSKCAYIERLSAYPGQREILFDKNLLYRVVDKNDTGIVLEVLR